MAVQKCVVEGSSRFLAVLIGKIIEVDPCGHKQAAESELSRGAMKLFR